MCSCDGVNCDPGEAKEGLPGVVARRRSFLGTIGLGATWSSSSPSLSSCMVGG